MTKLEGSITGARVLGGSVTLGATLGGSVTLGSQLGGSISATPDPTDLSVIVVMLDDLGTELLDWMGVGEIYTTDPAFEYAPTPFLSQMAVDGIWWSQFYATPLCSPSRGRLHTGLRSDQTGIGQNCRQPSRNLDVQYPAYGFTPSSSITYLAKKVRTVRPAVSTAYFGKWHINDMWGYDAANAREDYPPNVNLTDYWKFGFQEFLGGPLPYGGSYEWWKVSGSGGTANAPEYVKPGTPAVYDETNFVGAVECAAATSWLSARTSQFFCVVSIDPPHSPVTIPPFTMLSSATQTALTTAGLAAGDAVTFSASAPNFRLAYRTAVECADTIVKRVWDSVPVALKPKTVLIVVSDNGTQLDAVPLGFSHWKDTLYWGGTRVPCLMKGPAIVSPNREVRQIADIADLYNTVVDLMGCKTTTTTAPESISLLPAMQDLLDREHVQAIKPFVIEQMFYPLGATNPATFQVSTRGRSVTDGRYRIVYSPDIAGGIGFYDTATDPLEVTNIYGSQTSEFNRLNAALVAKLPV
jgi:arylsulfatase A-like enzyme